MPIRRPRFDSEAVIDGIVLVGVVLAVLLWALIGAMLPRST